MSSNNFQPIEMHHQHQPVRPTLSIQASGSQSTVSKPDLQLTSHKYSTYRITTPNRDIKAGKDITMMIQSRNGKDENLRTGGDFWQASIFWTSPPRASCAGKVTDHQNGTYTVRFHVVRTGLGLIHIILVHPKKAVDFLRMQVWHTEGRVYWLGKYSMAEVGGDDYWSKCYVTREMASEDEDRLCLYGNPDALGETLFVCEKQNAVSCDMLTHTRVNQELTRRRTLQLTGRNLHLFERLVGMTGTTVHGAGLDQNRTSMCA